MGRQRQPSSLDPSLVIQPPRAVRVAQGTRPENDPFYLQSLNPDEIMELKQARATIEAQQGQPRRLRSSLEIQQRADRQSAHQQALQQRGMEQLTSRRQSRSERVMTRALDHSIEDSNDPRSESYTGSRSRSENAAGGSTEFRGGTTPPPPRPDLLEAEAMPLSNRRSHPTDQEPRPRPVLATKKSLLQPLTKETRIMLGVFQEKQEETEEALPQHQSSRQVQTKSEKTKSPKTPRKTKEEPENLQLLKSNSERTPSGTPSESKKETFEKGRKNKKEAKQEERDSSALQNKQTPPKQEQQKKQPTLPRIRQGELQGRKTIATQPPSQELPPPEGSLSPEVLKQKGPTPKKRNRVGLKPVPAHLAVEAGGGGGSYHGIVTQGVNIKAPR